MAEPFDKLEEPKVKQILNQNMWDEWRYLIILYGCTRLQPFSGSAVSFDGYQAILRSTMREFAQNEKVSRFAFPPQLQFEFYKGASKMLEQRLERELGYVKTFKKNSFTYYALTPKGAELAESALAQAVKDAESREISLETMPLPKAILDTLRRDLKERVNRGEVAEKTVNELMDEYEKLEPTGLSPEVVASEPVVIKLKQKTFTVGRVQSDESFPNDRFMSRKHAVIEWTRGQYSISDQNSKNGIYRIENEKRIKIQRETIKPNAIYVLGTTRIIFST